MRIAFKEWAVVVDALGRGAQIVVLRKGGIAEGAGGFGVEHPRFLLFPTLFHQQRESVTPAAQRRFDEIAPELPGAETVRIEFVAEVVDWCRLESLDAARRLAGQHIWREEVIAERFEWGKRKDIHALALRVLRLPARVELPMAAAYGGCKSWVELEREIAVEAAPPVLEDVDFAGKLLRFRAALNLGSVAVAH